MTCLEAPISLLSPYSPADPKAAQQRLVTPAFPGIEAEFSLDKYLCREALLAATNTWRTKLPTGFPLRIDSPAVWSSSTLTVANVTYRVSQADASELKSALEHFIESGLDLNRIAPDTFHLPSFGPKLRDMSRAIHSGTGVFIIKGLQPDKYDLRSNVIIFAGISSYIGDQRGRQSAQNDVLTHLYPTRDKTINDPRPGLSNHGLPFHNDHCDILALYVLETARAGGATRWASFAQMYNEMVREKPQVLEVLARNDWPHETPSRAVKHLPLMFIEGGNPFVSFTRFALTGLPSYPRGPNAPQLSPEQADALDTLQFVAGKYAVEVEQEKGDILLINNRAVLHARDKIRDTSDDSRRHLMRLCLRDTEFGRPIPDDLKRRWGDIFDGNDCKNGKWMLAKEHDASFVSNSRFDSAFTNDETTGSHG